MKKILDALHPRVKTRGFYVPINLSEYAGNYGYEIVKKDTTASSIKMRLGNDTIIVSKKNGTWCYFSVSDNTDNGTIIEFLKNRKNLSMPEIANTLLKWLGEDHSNIELKYHVSEQEHDPQRVKFIFRNCKPAGASEVLKNRNINREILESKRFNGTVFIDKYANS